MRVGDTIMALSSGAVPAGVAVIRLSGPLVSAALEAIAGDLPEPRKLVLRSIGGAKRLDQGLVAYFPAPRSFTGEDSAELHVHGSPAGVRSILAELGALGLRLADAGEFTRRAFENGKLDLLAIEGLGDLLSAETEGQRRQALARYDGGLRQAVDLWREMLLDLRAEIEARLDFADEGDVSEDLPPAWHRQIAHLAEQLKLALATVESGRIVREGIRVALAGPPNAGKSSLLNALARSDIAIVSDEAGTTRDVREVPLDIAGQKFILLDLAGLRETQSKAEAEGVRRAHLAIDDADIVLWLNAPDIPAVSVPQVTGKLVVLHTKSDLRAHDQELDLNVSAQDGTGLDILVSRLAREAEALVGTEPSLVSHERDRQALSAALASVLDAQKAVDWELAAESLRLASATLERYIGRLDPERVLDRLFSNFCIGK